MNKRNLFADISKILKKVLMIAVCMGGLCAGAWGTNYTYSSNESLPDSSTFSSGDTITINGSVSYNGSYEIPSGVTFTIKAGKSLTISNGGLTVSGTILNYGTVSSSQALKIESTGKITNYSSGSISSGNTSENNGTISNSGKITFNTGTFSNSGTITNTGTISTSNGLNNSNSGTITNSGSFTSGDTVSNSGTINNSGTFTVSNNITNDGVINNNGTMSASTSIKNTSTGTVTNTGNISTSSGFTNTDGGTVNNEEGYIEGTTSGTITGSATNNYVFTGEKDSNWATASILGTNWTNNSATYYLQPDIDGSDTAKIKFEADATVSGDLTAFGSGTKPVTLFLNGHSLTVTGFFNLKGTNNTFKIIGPGEVTVEKLDSNDDGINYLTFSNDVKFTVKTTLYGNLGTSGVFDISGDEDNTCEFYLPASGANVNYGENKISYTNITRKPYGTPQIYKVTADSVSPISTTGMGITFYKTTNGYNSATVNFKYKVELKNSSNLKWTLGSTTLSDTNNNYSYTQTYAGAASGSTLQLKATDTDGNTLTSLPTGAGIVITFLTPDSANLSSDAQMQLSEIRYVQGEISWTGSTDTDFADLSNWYCSEWTNSTTDAEKVSQWQSANELIIPSGCTNYPVYDSTNQDSSGTTVNNLTANKIVIKNGASLTVDGRILGINDSIVCEGTGKILASSGTVNFNGSSSLMADYPEYSTFGTINIGASATFTPKSNIYITGTLDNSFGGTYDAVTNKITTFLTDSSTGFTVSGNSTDTSFEKTKFYTLDCTNQGGKKLTINNYISVTALNLSGSSNSSLLTITGSGGSGTGDIKIPANQTTGDYIDFKGTGSGSEPKIADSKTYTVFHSVFPSDTSTLTAKGWKEGDPDSFVWVGKSSNWNSTANWSVGIVPGAGAKVIIPSVSGSYPELADNLDLGTGSITIEENAKLYLGGKNLTCSALDIKGTIGLKASETITATVTKGTGWEVECYGGSTVTYDNTNNHLGYTLSNLSVVDSTTVSFAGDINVTKAAVNGTIISNGNQTYTSSVTLNGNSTFIAGTNAVSFPLNTGSATGKSYNLTVGNSSNATNAKFTEIHYNSTYQIEDLTVYGNANFSTSDSNGWNCMYTNGNQTYKGAVTITASASATAPALVLASYTGAAETSSKTITFESSVNTGTVANLQIGTDANSANTVIFNGDITSKNVKSNYKTEFNSAVTVTTETSQEYVQETAINAAVTFTSKGSGNNSVVKVSAINGRSSGTLSTNVEKLQADSIQGLKSITLTKTGAEIASYTASGSVTFKGTSTVALLSNAVFSSPVIIDNGAGLSAGSTTTDSYEITLNGNWTDNSTSTSGGFTANNSTVVIADDCTLSGKTTFYNLKTDNTITATKTLTIESGSIITVNGDLTIKGNSTDSANPILWNITGTGNLTISKKQSCSYLSVAPLGYGPNITDTSYDNGYRIIASYSKLSSGTTPPKGWNIFQNEPEWTWVGGTADKENDWQTETNWNIGTTPNTNGTSVVVIPRNCTYYPNLSSNTNIAQLTIESGASLTLNNFSLTLAGNYSNNGTIYTTGASSELVSLNNSATITESGTWSFTGTTDTPGVISKIDNLNYNNIEITGTVKYSSDTALTANGNLTVSTSANLTLSAADIKVSGTFENYGTVIYSNTGRIKNSVSTIINDTTTAHAGSIDFNYGSTDTNSIDNIGYVNLKISSGTWKLPDTITVSGTTTIDNGATLDLINFDFISATVTNNGTVQLYGNQTLPASDKITNGENSTVKYYGGSSGSEITAKLFGTNFYNLEVSQYTTLEINENTTINTAGSVTNNGVMDLCVENVKLKTDAARGTGTVRYSANNTIADYGETDFYNLEITAYAAVTVNSNITAAGNITNDGTITVSDGYALSTGGTFDDSDSLGFSGNITFAGSSDQAFKAFASSARTYEVTVNNSADKTVIVDKAITCSKLTLTKGSVEFIENASITSYSDTEDSTGSITFDGTADFTSTDETKIQTKGTVTTKSTLTAAGPLSITQATLVCTDNVTVTNNAINLAAIKINCADNSTVKIEGSSISIKGTVLPSSSETQSLTLTATTGTITVGNDSKINIGLEDKKFKNITVSTDEQNVTFSGDTTLYASGDINISGKNVSFDNYVIGNNLLVSATETVAISGLRAKSFVISRTPSNIYYKNGTKDGNPFPITITNGDFSIDYAATLNGDTTFDIQTGKFTLDDLATADKKGSIASSISDSINLSIKAANGIIINNNLATSDKLLETVTFNSDVTFSVPSSPASPLHIYANKTIFAEGSSLNAGNFSIEKDITINKDASITYPAIDFIVPGDMVNAGTASFTNGVKVGGNFADSGTWSDGIITLNGTTQTFTPKGTTTTYPKIIVAQTGSSLNVNTNPLNVTDFTITSSGAVTFEKAATVGTFTSAATGDVTFNSNATISTYTTAASATGNITFNGDTVIKSDTNFTTSGTVSFAAEKTHTFNDGTFDKAITHTDGNTSIAGNFSCAALTLGNTTSTDTISGTVTASDNITLNGITTFRGTITADRKDVTFKNNLIVAGTDSTLPSITAATVSFGSGSETISVSNSTDSTANLNITGAVTNKATTTQSSNINVIGTVQNYSAYTINGKKLTASDGFTNSELCTITLNADSEIAANITNKGTLSTSGSFGTATITGTYTSESRSSTTITSGMTLKITSDVANGGNWTNNGIVTATGNFANNGTLTNNDTVTISSHFTNGSAGYVSGSGNLNLSGNFTDSGNWTDNITITLNGTTQTFEPKGNPTTYTKIVVAQTGSSLNIITNPLNVGTFTITSSGAVTFETEATIVSFTSAVTGDVTFSDTATIGTYKTDENATGKITFSAGGLIKSDTDFTTTGKLTLGGSGKTISFSNGAATPTYCNLTHTSGETEISADVSCAELSLSKITNSGTIISTSAQTYSGSVTNSGIIKTADATTETTIWFKSDYSATGTLIATKGITQFDGNATFDTGSNFTNSNGTVVFNGAAKALSITPVNIIFNNVTINSGASLSTSSSFEVTGNWTNDNASGGFTATDSSTINFTGIAITVNGSNTFITANFTNGKLIHFVDSNTFTNLNFEINSSYTDTTSPVVEFAANKTQTVNGILSSKGFDDGTNNYYITLTTDHNSPSLDETIWWILNWNGTSIPRDGDDTSTTFINTVIQYSKSENDLRHDWGTTVTEGIPGSTDNWFFRDFYWYGTTDTQWTNPDNWKVGRTENKYVSSVYPVYDKGINEIHISDSSSNILKLENNINVQSITVHTDQAIDLADKNVKIDSYINYGRTRLSGNQTISASTIENSTETTTSTNSTVEYYGSCANLPMSAPGDGTTFTYQNLEFTNGANGTIEKSVTVTGTTLIANGTDNTLSIKGKYFDGKITLGNTSAQAGIINITSETDLTIADNAKTKSLLINAKDEKITFEGSLITTDGDVTLTGNVYTTGGNTETTATFTIPEENSLSVAGNFINTGKLSITSSVAITKNFTNSGTASTITVTDITTIDGSLTNSGTADFQDTVTVGGNFADTGTWIDTASETDGLIILNGADNQTFTANSEHTYNSITVTSQKDLSFTEDTKINELKITETGNLTFEKDAAVTNLSITKSGGNTFESTATIGSLSDTANAGPFTFKGNSTFNSDTVFLTTGIVTLGSAADSKATFISADNSDNCSFTHTEGSTELYGIITASDISLGNSNCNTDLIINCAKTTLYGDLTCAASVTYAKLSGNLVLTGTINISPDFILDGSLTGNADSLFLKNLYLYTNATDPSDIKLSDINVTEDLIIDAPRNISTSGTISGNNVVLYRGNITASANSLIKAEKDVVLLGADYSIEDTINGTEDGFKYQKARLSPWNYSRTDFTQSAQMPDGTELSAAGGQTSQNSQGEAGGQTPENSSTFAGSYKANSGATIYVGKNFYANGLTLSGYDQWYILVPNISDANNGFAETYYSQVDHSTVYCHNGTVETDDDSTDGSKARMPAFRCADNNDNEWWIFENFEITEAYTIRDNVIYIKFNHPIRNINNELTLSLSRFTDSDGENSYIGFYTDADCTTPVGTGNILTKEVYIKAVNSWNTDATGTSAGTENSTDRTGTHKESLPYIEISDSAVSTEIQISDIWGKKIKKYSGDDRYTEVQDKTGPVLYSVKTGQELHTTPDGTAESQHSYDAHNFIEFRYSEPTNFGSQDTEICGLWIPAYTDDGEVNLSENIQVEDSFGAIKGDVTEADSIILSNLGTLEKGKLYTGADGKANKYVNALYRKDPYSICLSIAGYTEDTVTDPTGNIYKKWIGYIETAIIPSGSVTMNFAANDSNLNPVVADINGNYQEQYADTTQNTIPVIDSTSSGIYGSWDLSEPIFAPLRLSTTKTVDGVKTNNWTSDMLQGKYQSEAIGNTSGIGSTLDRIEFHLFDNTPVFDSTEPEWASEIGWINPDSEGTKSDLYKDFSYSADIFGGSRAYNDENRTSGGIRYSSVCNAAEAFKYINAMDKDPSLNFITDQPAYEGAAGLIFTGTSTPRRSALDLDGLYFALALPTSTYDIKTTFTVSYDSTNSYITDLAGNRLRSKVFQTIDRTPPSFDITLSPINQNEIYVTFVKQLVTDTSQLIYIDNDGNVIDVGQAGTFENIISSCFKLITIDENGYPSDSTDIQVDSTRPAEIMDKSSDRFTCIKLYLTKNVTLENVQNLYLAVKNHPDYSEYSTDPFTSHKDSRVTFIQDLNKNYMEMYTAHALSDFVIDGINPLYAYDEDMSAEDDQLMNGLYEDGSWAVHDWTADQKNYGTLPAGHAIGIVTELDDGTTEMNNLPKKARIYLSNNPDASSISKQYNTDFNDSLRIWLPSISEKVFSALSETDNTNYSYVDSQLLDADDLSKGLLFDIPQDITQNWASKDQVTFLFGLMDDDNNPVKIIHSPELDLDHTEIHYLTTSTKYPLFALRLATPGDITSIDLWSFKLKSITEQRGGVSILNNVINNTVGEKTVVKVNLPEAGKLNVIVMTLDGNVVTYLNRGQTSAGEHYYAWDGKNRNGTPVARGLYFVRVSADGIDETRKVMVVK